MSDKLQWLKRRFIESMSTTGPRFDLVQLLNSTAIDFKHKWSIESFKTYMLLLSKPNNPVDPLEIFYQASRSGLGIMTRGHYKSESKVFQDIYESLFRVEHNNVDGSIFFIIEPDGTLSPLKLENKPLLSDRGRVIRFISGTINIAIYPKFDAEQYELNPGEMNRTIVPYRQTGSLLINLQGEDKNYFINEQHTDDGTYCQLYDTCSEKQIDVLNEYFSLLVELEEGFVDAQSIELEKLKQAIEIIFESTKKPIPINTLMRSLDTVIEMIENFDRTARLNERTSGVRWDLFGEALLSYFGNNPSPKFAIEKLKDCTLASTNEGSYSRHYGCNSVRNSILIDRTWINKKIHKSVEKFMDKFSPKATEIISGIEDGKIDGQRVIDSMLSQSNSLQDPKDTFWVAVEIAKTLKKSDPHLLITVHRSAIDITNSTDVSKMSPYPTKDEWYSRLLGGKNDSCNDLFLASMRKKAGILSSITEQVKNVTMEPTTTDQLLAMRTVDTATTPGAVELVRGLTQTPEVKSTSPQNIPGGDGLTRPQRTTPEFPF